MDIEHLDYITNSPILQDFDFKKIATAGTITQASDAISELFTNIHCHNFLIHVDAEIMVNNTFVNFCKENSTEVECLKNLGTVNLKLDNEEKLVSQGIFKITSKSVTFYYVCLFRTNNSQDEIISFVCVSDNKDLGKYFEFKKQYVLFKNKNKVNVIGVGKLEIKNSQPMKDLFLDNNLKQITVELDKFFKEEKSVKCMLLSGPAGSGKSTVIKGIVKDYNLFTIAVNGNLNPDILFESFRLAEQNGPSIIVLEYLDEWLGSIIDFPILFQLIDNLNPKHNVLVLGTVDSKENLPEVLFVGPNRFETVFECTKPTKELVSEFLKSKNLFSESLVKSLSKKAASNELEWIHLALFVSNCIKSKGTGDLSDSRINTLFNSIIKEKELFEKKINFDKYFV